MKSLLLGLLGAVAVVLDSLGGILKTIGFICFVVMCPLLNLWTANLLFATTFPYDVAHWGASFWMQVCVLILAMYLKPNVTINNFGVNEKRWKAEVYQH